LQSLKVLVFAYQKKDSAGIYVLLRELITQL
jgi:hypothetical protein